MMQIVKFIIHGLEYVAFGFVVWQILGPEISKWGFKKSCLVLVAMVLAVVLAFVNNVIRG